MTVDPSWSTWAQGVLAGLGGAADQANLDTLAAWSEAESGASAEWMRWNNPLNTTQPAPGSRAMNDAGVQAYPDIATGVQATVTTLTNGRYPTIVDHLVRSVPAAQWADACGELDTWGTGCGWIGGATGVQAPPPARSLYGQGVVGQMLTSPWFPGSWEITQGYGPTDYDGEPEGHGYQHWHAGVDVGVACGTTITLPAGLSGTAQSLDNPNGYGTALIVLLDGTNVGILLGHLRQRLVESGQVVSGGTQLAISNSTGNSTGCHVHFEVRPQDPKQPLGVGRYGTDVDPSQWLTAGQAGTSAELLSASSSPTQGISDALKGAVTSLVAGAQVLLGAGLVLGGLIATAYGLRGGTPEQLGRAAQGQARALAAPRRRARPRPAPATSEAGETRVRPDLQRPVPGVQDLGRARVRRVRAMTSTEARVAAVRGRR